MNKLLTTLSILLVATASYAQTYTVERVIDGNTIVLNTGEKVRLTGIDTSESKPNDKVRRDADRSEQDIKVINEMGEKATSFVKTLAWGQKVRLEYDVQKKDKYGRTLAYVFIEGKLEQLGLIPEWTIGTSKRDGNLRSQTDIFAEYEQNGSMFSDKLEDIFLNATIISFGYATPMAIPPNVRYATLFREWYEEARENKRGLWTKTKNQNYQN